MKNRMKVLLVIGAVVSLCGLVKAQSNTPPSTLGSSNTQSSIGLIGEGLLHLGLDVYDAMPTNIVVAPYGTYVMDAKKFGYGVFSSYNISLGPVQGGPAIAVDHVDTFLAFSGGLTINATLHPFKQWGITNFAVVPFGFSMIGTPLGGAGTANGGIQTANSLGADIHFGHLWGGQFLVGGAYGTRTGAGAYSGGYINAFVGWKKGF